MDFNESVERIIDGVKESLGEETIKNAGITLADFDNLARILQDADDNMPTEDAITNYWHKKFKEGDIHNKRVVDEITTHINIHYAPKFNDEFTFHGFSEDDECPEAYFKSKKYDCIFSVIATYKDEEQTIIDKFYTNYMEYVFEEQATKYYQAFFDEILEVCKVFYSPCNDIVTGGCSYISSFDDFLKNQWHEVIIFTSDKVDADSFKLRLIGELKSRKIIISSIHVCNVKEIERYISLTNLKEANLCLKNNPCIEDFTVYLKSSDL